MLIWISYLPYRTTARIATCAYRIPIATVRSSRTGYEYNRPFEAAPLSSAVTEAGHGSPITKTGLNLPARASSVFIKKCGLDNQAGFESPTYTGDRTQTLLLYATYVLIMAIVRMYTVV